VRQERVEPPIKGRHVSWLAVAGWLVSYPVIVALALVTAAVRPHLIQLVSPLSLLHFRPTFIAAVQPFDCPLHLRWPCLAHRCSVMPLPLHGVSWQGLIRVATC